MKVINTTIITTLAFLAAPALGQNQQAPSPPSMAVSVQPGTVVYGSDGNAIGSVLAEEGGTVMVDTGANQIPVPGAAFANGEIGLTLNITKKALDAEYERQLAELAARLDAVLVVGAQINTVDEQPLGTVQAIEGSNVVIDAASKPLTIPKEYFSLDRSGKPIVLATMAQIREAHTDPSEES